MTTPLFYIDRQMTLKDGSVVSHIKTFRKLKGDPCGCYEVCTSDGRHIIINSTEVVSSKNVRVEIK